MFQGMRTVIYPAADLERAKAWYTEVLGVAPYFDEPFYVGFTVGGFELGLDPNTKPSDPAAPGQIAYWGVPDADAAESRLLSLGADARDGVQDVGEGIRAGIVVDPFGNSLGFIQNPHFSLESVR